MPKNGPKMENIFFCAKKNFSTQKIAPRSKNMRIKCAYFQADLSLLSMFFGRFLILATFFWFSFFPYLVTQRKKSWEVQIYHQNAPYSLGWGCSENQNFHQNFFVEITMFRGSICLEIAWACFPLFFGLGGATALGPAAPQKKKISKNHVPGLYLAWNSVFELSVFMDYFGILGGKKNFRTKKNFSIPKIDQTTLKNRKIWESNAPIFRPIWAF